MLCGLKTILTDMNILNSYRHIRPKKVKYPIPEIPDDSGKKIGYGLGIAKNYRVGSGIGYLSDTGEKRSTTIMLIKKMATVDPW